MNFSNNSSMAMPAGGEGVDAELKQFIEMETQKAKFQQQVHNFTDACWDKCVDKPGSKLDSRTETCLVNCVDRFIDTTMTIAQRFQTMSQRGGH